MEIWLDTIDYNVIADGVKTGIIAGITTNPSILSKSKNVKKTLKTLLEIQPGPVAVQVTSATYQEMIDEGMKIYEFSPRMIIKIPLNHQGLIAIKQLRLKKFPVLGTGILHPFQALLASNHEVSYIAPYFSHMGDPKEAFEKLKTMSEILRAKKSPTKILVASIRHIDHLIYCASVPVAVATIKPDLYHKLVEVYPAVESFSQKFSIEWNLAYNKLSIKDLL